MTGVFCLEGFWYGEYKDPTSVVDLLELVQRHNRMPFIHHRCATRAEFEYSLRRWRHRSFQRKYPVLYLSFHGQPGEFLIGEERVSLEELAAMIGRRGQGMVIHFGCCSTLKADPARLRAFLDHTGCAALMGYGKPVPWMASAAFELLLVDGLAQYGVEPAALRLLERVLHRHYESLVRRLDFDVVLAAPVAAKRPRAGLAIL